MKCTVCEEEIGSETKYFVVLKAVGGYRLLVGCEHNMGEWEEQLKHLPAYIKDDFIGVVGSFVCLQEMVEVFETGRCACEEHLVPKGEKALCRVN